MLRRLRKELADARDVPPYIVFSDATLREMARDCPVHDSELMAVTGVGKDMVRDARYFGLATRIAAELGAQFVKSYYVDEGFERIVLGCPVPIVIAGGKKLPERDALEMAYRAIDQGAAGVDMGRNVFQSSDPAAMLQALAKVVHEGERPEQAYALFKDLEVRKAA